MADFGLPTLTTGYAEFLAQMKQRDEDIIKMLDGTTSSNLPSGAKRWNATANKWEKYNGTAWSDLSTLYEIKVADSKKLNGQLATYYAIASHTHTGYAATNHTHSEYAASAHNHNSSYLGVSAKAADSSKLNGRSESATASANTIGLRDASGDFFARWFRSTYAEQTTTPAITADICFRNDASTDNYMRFMSSAAFKAWLTAIGVAVTDTDTVRDVTNSVTTTSSVIAASATAVKTAYDKAVQALNEAQGSLSSSQVGNATAGLAAGSVGSYSYLYATNNIAYSYGATLAGSSLKPAGNTLSASYGIQQQNSARSGTWRCMGYNPSPDYTGGASLWLRIA